MIYTVTLNPAVDRELVVPDIAFNTVLRASEWRIDFGGKGFNVARMLKALGASSVALGFAGGNNGQLLRNGLESMGIETDFEWVPGETRINVSIVAADNEKYIKVNEPGPTISAADLSALKEKVRRLVRSNDWWVLAGSLPPGVPPTVYAELITIIQQAGAHAILDTSDEALRYGCEAKPFLVKPNTAEAAKLTALSLDYPAQMSTVAAAIRKMGPAHVVISMGKAGALVSNGHRTWAAASPEIVERNPIGAGDAMVGGLVWGLSQGQDLQDAFALGIACGAATAGQRGTCVGSLENVTALLAQIQMVELHHDITDRLKNVPVATLTGK